MKIQVDQSGKVEQLDTKTAVAGSNVETHTISLAAGVKQRLKRHLLKSIFPTHDIPVIIFSVLIYLLIQQFKHQPTVIEIDEEYSGKSDLIEEILLKLYSRDRKRAPDIRFSRIGKHSSAHRAAWKAHRQKKDSKNIIVTENKILKFWK